MQMARSVNNPGFGKSILFGRIPHNLIWAVDLLTKDETNNDLLA